MASAFPLNPTKVRRTLKRPSQKKASPKITYDLAIYKEARDINADEIEVDVYEIECCGGREISGINRFKRVSTDILVAHIIYTHFIQLEMFIGEKIMTAKQKKFLPAFFLFTDIYSPMETSAGIWLADFIEQQELGDVSAGVPNKNYNSGNLVQGFLWTCDRDAIADWWNKKGRFYINC